MSTITKVKQTYNRNVDNRIVVSAAVGSALFGAVLFAMHKSNIKALKSVAKVAKGGK